jgi:hypothetical protein
LYIFTSYFTRCRLLLLLLLQTKPPPYSSPIVNLFKFVSSSPHQHFHSVNNILHKASASSPLPSSFFPSASSSTPPLLLLFPPPPIRLLLWYSVVLLPWYSREYWMLHFSKCGCQLGDCDGRCAPAADGWMRNAESKLLPSPTNAPILRPQQSSFSFPSHSQSPKCLSSPIISAGYLCPLETNGSIHRNLQVLGFLLTIPQNVQL